MARKARSERNGLCCCCIPLQVGSIIAGVLLAVVSGLGCWAFFTNMDAPDRLVDIGGVPLAPFASGHGLWIYFGATCCLGAAVGLFGTAVSAFKSRRGVKAFEAFYVLTLLAQFGLLIWSIIYIRQQEANFDVACENGGLVDRPSFSSGWSCSTLYRAVVITFAVCGVIWLLFNFFLTNVVIRYARALFALKANRFQVLGPLAEKEQDREQQIPLNLTNHATPYAPVTTTVAYPEDIEQKDQRFSAGYEHIPTPDNYAGGHYYGDVAPGFEQRSSAQGLDHLVNPYYDQEHHHQQYQEQQHQQQQQQHMSYVPAPITMESTPSHLLHASSTSHIQTPYGGQSFTHIQTKTISSPFDEEPLSPVVASTSAAAATGPISPTSALSSGPVAVPVVSKD